MVVIWFWPTLFMCAAGRHLAYTVCVTFVCAAGDKFRVCAMGASAYGVCWMRLLHMLLTIGVQLFAVHFTPHPFRVKMYPALNAVIEWCAES